MKQITFHILLCLSALLLPTACSDDFLPQTQGDTGKADDGIGFSLSVVEQADRLYQLGRQTRAASLQPDSNLVEANTFVSRPFTGDMAGLQVHRMPLPLVGIHPHTATGCEVSGATRAKLTDIVDAKAINFHDSLTIWGYTDKGRPLFDQILLTKINGWRSSVHWPYDLQATTVGDVVTDAQVNPAAMRFYAIAPALEGVDVQVANTPAPAYGQPPVFTYTVPDNPVAQRDLLYGQSADVDIQAGPTTPDPATLYPGADTEKQEHLGLDDKVVALQFSHILTAVRFAQGKMPVGSTVKLIELYHIKNKGTYTPGTGWAVDDGTTATYDLNVSHTVGTWDRSGENTYIDGGNVLFLMPHTLTSAAELHVTLTDDGGTDHTVSCKLTGDEWLPGYTVTYKITVGDLKGDYYLAVEPESCSHDHGASGDGSIMIHSYRNYKNYSTVDIGSDVHHAVDWKVAGFSDPVSPGTFEDGTYTLNNEHAVAWINSFTSWDKGGDGSSSPQTGGDGVVANYNMNSQSASQTKSHATILTVENSLVTSFNLSTNLPNGAYATGDKMNGYTGSDASDNIYNSANSYIVNAKGTYKFPLVYGNSYKNGSVVNFSTANPGGIFKDHQGNAIAYANILKQINSVEPDKTDGSASFTASDFTEEQKTAAKISKIIKETRYTYGKNASGDITAGLLWQDVENLFSGVNFAVSPNEVTTGFISFQVSNTPQPGNCIIALYGKKCLETIYRAYTDDACTSEFTGTVGTVTFPTTATYTYSEPGVNEILWTWHIWCTDEVYPNGGTVDQYYLQYHNGSKIVSLSNGSKILPVNLGWVPDAESWSIYEPREIWVKLVQTEGTEAAYLKLRREAVQDLPTGTSNVYQWGRPTALPMTAKINGAARVFYDLNKSLGSASILTPEAAISNPTKMATGWAPTAAYWSATQKTLYDPCPPGFRLPAGTVFTPFSLTDAAATNDATHNYLNLWPAEGADSRGGYFYATAHTALPASSSAERYAPKVYIPATGTWSDSYAQANTTTGYYWTGTSGTSLQVRPNSGAAGFINFGATSLGNGYALPVRAVAE